MVLVVVVMKAVIRSDRGQMARFLVPAVKDLVRVQF